MVMIPRGASAKMNISMGDTLSLRNCFVGDSPNKDTSGARSVARLLKKSSHQSEEMIP